MKYEIVEMKEKLVVGVQVEVDDNPQMPAIREAWEKVMFGGVYETIRNRCGAQAIGLYTDYAEKSCKFLCGAEVSENGNPELAAVAIPAGRYARFVVKATAEEMDDAVAKFWAEEMQGHPELGRLLDFDYEEYPDRETAHIFIALK
ncbi:MAG: GyrI-like domain-containing protein [Clostridiales Family XIII bacterium]|nr:GyrI-like domain-containing protein [Clostridiales Family XIII bacterium]